MRTILFSGLGALAVALAASASAQVSRDAPLRAAVADGLQPPFQSKDKIGDTGKVSSLIIHSPGSSDFSAFRGEIAVGTHRQGTIYRWGGSACPGKDLEDVQELVLTMAFENGWLLTPKGKPGAGSNKCLTGLMLRK